METEVRSSVLETRRSLDEVVGRRKQLQGQLARLVTTVVHIEDDLLPLCTDVRRLCEVVVVSLESKVRDYIEPLVTEALDSVFGYDLRFKVDFVRRRNQSEVDLYFTDKSGTRVLGNLEDVYGGGVQDVTSVVLRFVLCELLHVEGPIVLDEPSRFVDETHQERLGMLLSQLSRRFSRQVVFVTHSERLAAASDKVYRVEMVDGVSKVTEEDV